MTVVCPKCKTIVPVPKQRRKPRDESGIVKECYRTPDDLYDQGPSRWWRYLGFNTKSEWYFQQYKEAKESARRIVDNLPNKKKAASPKADDLSTTTKITQKGA